MTISIVNGNILDGDWETLVHSVNHQGVMGAGLAKQIAMKWPEIVTDYKEFCKRFSYDDIRRIGIYHLFVLGGKDAGRFIAGIVGQDDYGKRGKYTDYAAIATSLVEVAWYADRMGLLRIAIPFGMGCGLGGGDWNVVYPIVQDVFNYYPHLEVKIYKYER